MSVNVEIRWLPFLKGWPRKVLTAIYSLGRFFMTYYRSFLTKKIESKKVIIILGTRRSGSSLLMSLLRNNLKDFHNDRENFNARYFMPMRYLEGSIAGAQGHIYLVKVFVGKFEEEAFISLENFVASCNKRGWKVVSITRENSLLQGLSFFKAQTGLTAFNKTTEGSEEFNLVEVNPEIFLDYINYFHELKNKQRKIEREEGLLSVVYEDDLLDLQSRERTLRRICDYVGIDFVCVETEHLKQRDDKNIFAGIKNKNELLQAIKKSDFAHYLD